MTRCRECFNVTAPVMARKYSIPCVFPASNSCFNVTAPVMARKCALAEATGYTVARLQCDRACYGAEMFEYGRARFSASRLQCDRACYGAEILRAGHGLEFAFHRASM